MEKESHMPCKYRKREKRDGVELDWCYAIGCVEVGDMPCEYCSDRKKEETANGEKKTKRRERRERR